MWFGILTLATALIISVGAAYYSILGLTAIFAAAFWPIVILGSSLEVGKIVSTLWLHKYWHRAEMQYKIYLSAAVAILMVLTSMGVFGFLSKAHLDQAVPSGDVQAQVQIYDDKIKTQRDNIEAARKALRQMDEAVDQTMSRSSTEQGADKAANLRRGQARERGNLQNDISRAQTEITKLQEQRAPIASQARQIEAEVGPIKYIAALIYGDDPDANLLEKAVRWVIILIVVVFDPLALTLLLAATKTFEWERGINVMSPTRRKPEYEPDDGPLTDEQLDQLRSTARADLPQGPVVSKESLFQEPQEFFDRARATAQAIDAGTYEPPEEEPVKQPKILDGLNTMWNWGKKKLVKDSEAEHAPLDTPANKPLPAPVAEDDNDPSEKFAERAWKAKNPNDTLKRQRDLLEAGLIAELPWNEDKFQTQVLGQQEIQADNLPTGATGEVRGFGTSFPTNAKKGDMFLRVDRLPSGLYKYNGTMWIEVDKALSDSHAWDDAYIEHLIDKIASGEYDPDLLSDAERDCIEAKLKTDPPSGLA